MIAWVALGLACFAVLLFAVCGILVLVLARKVEPFLRLFTGQADAQSRNGTVA